MDNMEALWDFPSPLSINVRLQIFRLFQVVPVNSSLAVLQQAQNGSMLLSQLSRFMVKPAYTLPITQAFRPLLVDLCVRWLDDDENLYEKFEALALLVEVHEEIYPVLYRFLRAHFLRGPLDELKSSLNGTDIRLLQSVLLSYYRILRATPSLPEELGWDLLPLYELFNTPHPDRGVVWLAIRCYALQAGTSEARREAIENEILGERGEEDCDVYYGEDVAGASQVADGWVLPVLEAQRVQQYRDRLPQCDDYFSEDTVSDISLQASDLSPRTADVHGILLVREPAPRVIKSSLVPTSSAVIALRQIGVDISLRRPTLLTSAPSSGKATLVNHLAGLLFPTSSNQVVTIHLADTSLDPRSLLGSYVSSHTRPGEFEWKEGVLVKAMREGKWLLLKDIDRASSEVLGLIAPLAESLDDTRPIGSKATLSIPNRGHVEAIESFHMFATRSVENTIPPLFLGSQKWHEITIAENSMSDLHRILESKFPDISGPIADALTDIWLTVRSLPAVASARSFGIRDLEKFCNRVSSLFRDLKLSYVGDGDEIMEKSLSALLPNPSVREDIYLEARDVFFSAGANSRGAATRRDSIASLIGEKLGLSEEIREWVLKRRMPVFAVEKDVDGRPTTVRAGRTLLPVRPTNGLTIGNPVRGFIMHKQAIRLISQVAACVAAVEPVLLTGETGTGKTSIVSHLASLLNKPLISLNMSNQSEASDLVGGFRPVSARIPAMELHERFSALFMSTFSSKKNVAFRQSTDKAVAESKWKAAVKLWGEASKLALKKLNEELKESSLPQDIQVSDDLDSQAPRKRRKLDSAKLKTSVSSWTSFQSDVLHFDTQHVRNKGKFAFHYVEGPLVKAIRTGAWVLLDEINLASPETLECIAGLLQSPTASIILSEQGSLEPVPRHPEFRLFGCMNPATDVGKRDLPSHIRAKFTELAVPSPDEDQDALLSLINYYIGHLTMTDKSAVFDVAQYYTSVKALAEAGKLADMSNRKPHYSMRTLSRALTFAADTIQSFGLRRSLYEGFTMTFTMVLDRESTDVVFDVARRTILSSVKNVTHFLSQQPTAPTNSSEKPLVQIGHFWLSSGPNELDNTADYILTPSVQKKLTDLSRIITTRRYPILIEGPTSSGKTSAISYLARRTGHSFVRINNHEHTDIQEYLGSYVSDPQTGRLVFRDGLLVTALRQGHWVVLDELNLAPTDVLEALNRLLDDNRELVIPETLEVVKPHPNFVLFATQNPSGIYGGRKVLSRALRNRFLEVHFDDMPSTELEDILCEKSRIPPSYSRRMVGVFDELRKRRQLGRIFEGKQGFATLRDLFRWAGREAHSYDDLAENGYMLLAERARHPEDKQVVKEVIEKVLNVSISEDKLYATDVEGLSASSQSTIVWTKAMTRLYVLISRALQCNEPVLLVGETGSGKTSVCQVYAELKHKELRTVNCHQNTEASDIIGGLRPARHDTSREDEAISTAVAALERFGITANPDDREALRTLISAQLASDIIDSDRIVLSHAQDVLAASTAILGWQDGPLVSSMRLGDVFLLDEISLADDSVLERLNSVLEPSRTLILAEKGGEKVEDFEIVASEEFKFVATMNPGGDFGKKELSPALRNRFTEIWVPSIMQRSDLEQIVAKSWKCEDLSPLTAPILDFTDWISQELKDRAILTPRDILSWVTFCNTMYGISALSPNLLYVHGGQMAIVDGLSSLSQLSGWSQESLLSLRRRATNCLEGLVSFQRSLESICTYEIGALDGAFRMGPFSVPLGPFPAVNKDFNFSAPTTKENAFRLLRACQVTKPILLEGSPGVGKTSLVAALAAAAGQKLYRINLSEQTDLVDLFGSDLPINGTNAGNFAWSDADFLTALKEGHWVLLDEMNLASQSVLEGLNAVFDHRGTVYIPELDRSFSRHPDFRIFTAQNPLNQGSGRKGLPKSFLNRFTKVYVEQLTTADLFHICHHLYPTISTSTLQQMIQFNSRLHEEVVVKRSFGVDGQPWEFNLRDIMRWASLLCREGKDVDEPWKYLNTVYASRFRQADDRHALIVLFESIFATQNILPSLQPRSVITPTTFSSGSSTVARGEKTERKNGSRFLVSKNSAYEAALTCIAENWLVIVTGQEKSGKTSFVRSLAALAGQTLREHSLSNSSDTSDLIGSFEQLDNGYKTDMLCRLLHRHVLAIEARVSTGHITLFMTFSKLKVDFLRASNSRSMMDLLGVARVLVNILDETGYREDASALSEYLLALEQQETQGVSFGWVDGPLVEAMKHGDWLLLDNANLCSPSVLDRLNSLCELHGSLILTEKGLDQRPLVPHPNFRLIMTVNPRQGEISRAMRNRGIEIFLRPTEMLDIEEDLLRANRVCSISPSRTHTFSVTRHSFDLYRRSLLPAIRGSHEWNSTVRASGVLNEDYFAAHSIYYLDAISGAGFLPEEVLALFSLEISLFHYPAYTHRSFKVKSTRQNIPNSLESLLYSSSDIRHLLNRTTSSENKATPSAIDTRKYWPFSEFICAPYINWMRDVDLEYYTRLRERLEILIISEFLQNLSAKLRSRIPSLDSGEFNDENIRPSLPPVANLALVDFVSGFPKVLHRVLDGEQGLSFLSKATSSALLDLAHYARFLALSVNSHACDMSKVFVVAGWMNARMGNNLPPILHPFLELTNSIRHTFALSSGEALCEMWNALYYHPLVLKESSTVKRLLALLPLHQVNEDNRLRVSKRIVELAALDRAYGEMGQEQVNLLSKGTIELGQNDVDGFERFAGLSYSSASILALELDYVATLDQYSYCEEIINIALSCSDILTPNLGRLTAYQCLQWKFESNEDKISAIAQVFLEWMRSLWNESLELNILGPSFLLMPVSLQSSLNTSLVVTNDGTLQHMDFLIDFLDKEIKRNFLECLRPADRLRAIALLTMNVVILVCCSFPSSFDEEGRSIILELHESRNTLKERLKLLKRLSEHTSSINGAKSLKALVDQMSSVILQEDVTAQTLQSLGSAWVTLSRMIMSLYVPNLDLDPRRILDCSNEFANGQRTWLQHQVDLHSSLEYLRSGEDTNILIRVLRDRLDEIRGADDGQKPREYSERNRETFLLQSFWRDIRNFASDIVDSDRIQSLFASLTSGSSDCFLLEQLLQDSITNFLRRMKSGYALCQDLMPAIELSLLSLRFGLGIAVHSAHFHSVLPTKHIIEDVIDFDVSRACKSLRVVDASDLVGGSFSLSDSLSLKLLGLLRERTRGLPLAIKEVNRIYDKFMILWDKDKTDEAERIRQSESLYRNRNDDIADTGSVKEEEEIQLLFPVFREEETIDHEKPNSNSSRRIQQRHAEQLLQIHASVFLSSTSGDERMSWHLSQHRLASAFVNDRSMSCRLDNKSLAFRIRLLRNSKRHVQEASSGRYSFYRDANLPEARKAYSAVLALRTNLSNLIKEWPEQMVLQHLRDRCDKVLSLRSNSPLAMILGALERLLLHTEDWELYANRDNTLQTHRQRIGDLILEWRNLELASWKNLLDAESFAFCSDLSQWWFRLYDIVVRGTLALDVTGESDVANYLSSLTLLIEEFLSSAPMGQYKERLALVKSFTDYAHELSNSLLDSTISGIPILQRVRSIVTSVCHYYQQFSPDIDASFAEQRKGIERDIRNLMQVTNWRDANVHALQENAQRMHKQLYRRVRKFREILRQPISNHLQSFAGINLDDSYTPTSYERSLPTHEGIAVLDVPLDLSGKLRKFHTILMQDHASLQASTLSMDQLSRSIISVTEQFSKSVHPANLGAEQQKKWYASLTAQKRRTWNDMLKEFKTIGLTPHLKPDVFEQHQNRAHLMEQPVLSPPQHPSLQESARKIDSYLYRSIGVLTILLQSSANHHSDISTRDLQRGIFSFQHGFSIAMNARSILAECLSESATLHSFTDRLSKLMPTNRVVDTSFYTALKKASSVSCSTVDDLEEIITLTDDMMALQNTTSTLDEKVLDDLRTWKDRMDVVSQSFRKLLNDVESTSPAMMFQDEVTALSVLLPHFDDTKAFLGDLAQRAPLIAQFCEAARSSIPSCMLEMVSSPTNEEVYDSEHILGLLLVFAQELAIIKSDIAAEGEFDEANHVRRQASVLSRLKKSLKNGRLIKCMSALIQSLCGCDSPTAIVSRFLPFLQRYVIFFDDFIIAIASWTKSLLKLIYVSGTVLRRIASEGFCKPPDQEEDNGKGEGQLEASDGVGLGEGSGKDDVSKEIEDESQYEGMQDQKTDDEPQQIEGEQKNDLDVEFDLDGDLEDGPDDAGDDEEDKESLEDLDEEFGLDVDEPEESNPVNEDFWNEERKDGEADNSNQEAKPTSDDTEVVAKDEQQVEGQDHGEEAKDRDSAQEDPNKGNVEERPKESEAEQETENAHESETEGDKAEQSGADDVVNDAEDFEDLDNMEDGADEGIEGGLDKDAAEEAKEEEGVEDDVDMKDSEEVDQNLDETAEDETNEEQDASTAHADIQPGTFDSTDAGLDSTSIGPSIMDTENTALEEPNHDALETAEARASGSQLEQPNKVESQVDQSRANEPASEAGASMRSALGAEKPIPNPYRSPGDALKEVRRRINEILSPSQAEPMQPMDVAAEAQDVEYAPQDDMDVDMQALGPAAENEHANLKDLNVVDEESHDDTSMVSPEIESVERTSEATANKQNKSEVDDKRQDTADRTRDVVSKPHDNAEMQEDMKPAELIVPQDDEEQQQLQKHAEDVLSNWRRQGQPVEEAQYVWQLYESLTQSLSFTLCEQLRLILEPTRATRLMGDFRTGKRLNMKKIIPYIASNYTKDKIWLRRVKPSQREYQVLIALDDSRSMSESHSIHLAFQTLALVTKALTRLEAGDVAIASFGESMKTLHSFDDGPFTDHAGTQVVEAFKFQQTATDVRALLESSVELLMKARERRVSSSSSDLWQLEIIISDGICHDHEELRSLLRRAEEQHILIVFVVIDAPKSNADKSLGPRLTQDSIFDMKQATYRTVNGKMELHMQQYLDTFPFEYFVILKDVETLPDVLSDTLRQFFERLSVE